MKGENGNFVFHAMSMPPFADDLSTLNQLVRPVLDRTRMPGAFDFQKGPVGMLVIDRAERVPTEN